MNITSEGVIVRLRRQGRRMWCPCGHEVATHYDQRLRRWRHLDLGARPVWLEAPIRRLNCPGCRRVRTEQVGWARPAARHTYAFEQVVAWLAQRMDKTAVTELMRCSWEAVDAIVRRVVTDHLDNTRLDGLRHLGIDEISYRRGHTYLTVIANHDTGRVVWVGEGRGRGTVEAFFDDLGSERTRKLEAVTMDAAGNYMAVVRERAPRAEICLDPFHVVAWTNDALDAVYRTEPRSRPDPQGTGRPGNRAYWRNARYVLRAASERLSTGHREVLQQLRQTRERLGHAWELKEQLRDLYRTVAPENAVGYLANWISAAFYSGIPAMAALAQKIDRHFEPIIASVQRGLSNARMEGINTKIRVIQRRGYGHPTADSLAAMIFLCLGGINLRLPTQT
ncbi:ISL3 family transposase [Longispora sp. NPDC051575]|uniref:ISL3 family transposase n=1 Tax=Longispora sp. NPDC051575 TaxID=3154943 RepID=UPI0034393D8A